MEEPTIYKSFDDWSWTYWPSVSQTTGRTMRSWPPCPVELERPREYARKENIPGFSTAVFRGPKRAKDRIDHITGIGLDFDQGATLEAVIAALEPYAGLVYTTYSHTPKHPRCRAILPFPRPASPDEFDAVWAWMRDYLASKTLNIDTQCKDECHLWFVPAVPFGGLEHFRWMEFGEAPISLSKILEENTQRSAPRADNDGGERVARSGAQTKGRATHYFTAALSSAAQRILHAPTGSRNEILNKEAWSLARLPEADPQKITEALSSAGIQAGLHPSAVQSSLQSALKRATGEPTREIPPRPKIQFAPVDQVEADDNAWRAGLAFGKEGIKPTVANTTSILVHHPVWNRVLAYDEFSRKIITLKEPPWDRWYAPAQPWEYGQEWTENDCRRAAVWFSQHEGLQASESLLISASLVVADKITFHPVKEYLGSLRWDGKPRIDRFLPTYFGTEDNEYTRAVGSKWLISGIARVFQPGCFVKYMLILEGPQDLGKSSAIAALVGREWFTDELPELGSKDCSISLQGKWVVELAELDALIRADPARSKAFISRNVDRFRPPFGKVAKDFGRQCVFIGTVNGDTYLKDETGAVRFWPARCTRADVDQLTRDRDQLWAEALHRYAQNERWHLDTPQLKALARAEQSARYEGDVWEGEIAGYLHGKTITTIREILANVFKIEKEDWSLITQRRVGRCLKRLGWSQQGTTRINGEPYPVPAYRPLPSDS